MCTTCGCEEAHHHHEGIPPTNSTDRTPFAFRRVSVGEDLMAVNDRHAAANRHKLEGRGTFVVNVMSSPGAGKTTLLEYSIRALGDRIPVAVIEGDQQTQRDSQRIRAAGAPSVQINTGTGCHLDAHAVGHAIDELAPVPGSLLFIENVGNLVCPAGFDLGETRRVVVLSVTEGEDKPLKYPHMFVAADVLVLTKIDLLPHLDFDIDACAGFAQQVNPRLEILRVSARSGEGMDRWMAWLERGVACSRRTADTVTAAVVHDERSLASARSE